MNPIGMGYKCETGEVSESGVVRIRTQSKLLEPVLSNSGSQAGTISIPKTAAIRNMTPDPKNLYVLEDTFALIKPLTADVHTAAIEAIIATHGFEIVQQLYTTMTLPQAEMFYTEHRGKEFFTRLTEYMSSGPIVALHLRRAVAITGWRNLIGPTNVEKAREMRPDSIRAIYGLDGTRNAVHGSDSSASAIREISFFFSMGGIPPRILQKNNSLISPGVSMDGLSLVGQGGSNMSSPIRPSSLSPVKAPKGGKPLTYNTPTKKYSELQPESHLPVMSKADLSIMELYANYELDPILKGLLQKLMENRPPDVIEYAIRELSEMKPKTGGLSGSASAPKF